MKSMYAKVAMDVVREDWALRKYDGGFTYTQERLADAMGISRGQIARSIRKSSDKDPSISFLCSYCYAVGRSPVSLLDEIGTRTA